MSTRLLDLLATGGPIVADGGMGTMLIAAGLQSGDSPELWNVLPERMDVVRAIHRGYVAAGSQIILTNSFGGNPSRLRHNVLDGRVYELNRAAAMLARSIAGESVVVGGSIGPTGELLEPLGALTFAAAVAGFAKQARGLADGGVDVIWIETMADLAEVRAAIEGARRAAPHLPIVATMTFDTHGRTMMGVKPAQAVAELAALGVAATGANCGNGPDEIAAVIGAMREADATIPLVAKSNAGKPEFIDGKPAYRATPEVMAAYAREVAALGATIIGACCGSTPAHIAAIAAALQKTGR